MMNPAEILYWLSQNRSERIVATSSFQAQSLPLLFLLNKIIPMTPILFLDTGFHFRETLAYIDDIQNQLGLNIKMLQPKQRTQHKNLYKTNPDMCCYLSKVEPLQEELKHYDVWISGIRRDQTSARRNTPIIGRDNRNKIIKLCPMLNATREVIDSMNEQLDLPLNPLLRMGYRSVGCQPCTKIPTNANERSGRWQGTDKTECGLHITSHNDKSRNNYHL